MRKLSPFAKGGSRGIFKRQFCAIFPVNRRKNYIPLFLLPFLVLQAINAFAVTPQKKEFRGIWIATINNIDWPSSPGMSVAAQKQELKELIERIEQLNLNVVIFQIRPASDAFYPSETEPWSYFLTGKQGKAPSTDFDPLGYAIELCHSKGMELHAWFNPFRVRNVGYYKLDPSSFAARNPQFTLEYDHKLFLDPGFPQVRTNVIKVIMEVVRKYNIDAIHFDDYFYPYPVNGKKFPDLKSFHQYGKYYYPKKLNDWRRENINLFISSLHDSIKAVKPALKLGISPFGVWRNKSDDPDGSPGVKGTTSYDDLYADVVKWLANDWIDYIVPQLYWEQGNRFGDFKIMTKWWNDHSFGKPLYLGQALYKSTGADKTFINPNEITEQISILRKFENVGGFALYSASHLARLSATALNELKSHLSITKTEIGINTDNEAIARQIPAQVPSPPLRDRIFMADKKSITDTINLVFQPLIDKNIPVPEQFSVIKIHKGRTILWKTQPSIPAPDLKFSVLIFEKVKDGGYRLKEINKTETNQTVILRNSAINPSKVLFGIVSVNKNGYQSAFPKLFRIRGRRVIFN